jgi:signal transduction histidine kinase
VLFFVIATAIAGLMESLRRARARADLAARAREQLLAIVAHDLRNPLTTIKIAAFALAQDLAGAARPRRRAEIIQRSARRMENLIRDLVDATSIEHGGVQLTIQDTHIAAIVRETVDMFTPQATEKRVIIETAPFPAAPTIECDRERLLQVLGNLMGNALRFTPEGGRISLRAEPRGDEVRFEVKDTGPGIRPEDLPHIFERYWNSDRKGAGLGLYIAESFVRAHGGQIGVDTQPGQGATFFFTLPKRARPKREAELLGPWLRYPSPTR